MDTAVRFRESLNPIGAGALVIGGTLAESSGEASYTTRICGVGLGPLTPESTVRHTLGLVAKHAALEFAADVQTETQKKRGLRAASPHDINLLTTPRLPHASSEGAHGVLHYDGARDIDTGLRTLNLLRQDAVLRLAQGIELYHGY